MSSNYVLTVDIKSSRQLNELEREKTQNQVLNIINGLESQKNKIVTIGMTAGDEFQIVLNNPESIFDVYRFLQNNLQVKLYYGIGIGQIKAVKEGLRPSEMYGSAFYLSRDALDEAKKKEVNIVFKTEDKQLNSLLNVIMEFTHFIRNNWTPRQKEILSFVEQRFEHNEKIKQKFVANHFDVSEQYISKIFKKTGFELVIKGEERITSILKKKEIIIF